MDAESTATFGPGPGRTAAGAPPLSGVHTEEYVVTPEELDRCATLSGKLLDRRYQVGRRLGEGGMSYVYRAQDIETSAAVAVKILLPRLSRDPGRGRAPAARGHHRHPARPSQRLPDPAHGRGGRG